MGVGIYIYIYNQKVIQFEAKWFIKTMHFFILINSNLNKFENDSYSVINFCIPLDDGAMSIK